MSAMRFLRLRGVSRGLRSCAPVRRLTDFGGNSILGTSTITSNFLKDLQEDLNDENNIRKKGVGETLTNYVNSAELTHMESPEQDAKFLEKLGSQVDHLFAKIPLPPDPMRAALAPTEEEMEEQAAAEILREAVREAYIRKLDRKQAEELRIKRAMRKLEERKTADAFFVEREELERDELEREAIRKRVSEKKPTEHVLTGEDAESAETTDAEIRRKLAQMKLEMEKLENMLKQKKE